MGFPPACSFLVHAARSSASSWRPQATRCNWRGCFRKPPFFSWRALWRRRARRRGAALASRLPRRVRTTSRWPWKPFLAAGCTAARRRQMWIRLHVAARRRVRRQARRLLQRRHGLQHPRRGRRSRRQLLGLTGCRESAWSGPSKPESVAGRKLRGEIPRVFPTWRLEGLPATKFYIVLSERTVGGLAPPCLFNNSKRTYAHVSDATEDGLLDVAVFHGFPSLTECLEYCRGAQVPLPPRIFGPG